jgi:hypothetical protein
MSQQLQLALFEETSAAELLKKKEDQWFDRKVFALIHAILRTP